MHFKCGFGQPSFCGRASTGHSAPRDPITEGENQGTMGSIEFWGGPECQLCGEPLPTCPAGVGAPGHGSATHRPSRPQPHLAVGSNDYYISVYSVEKRVR